MSYRRRGLGQVTVPAGTLAPAGGKTTDRSGVLTPGYTPRLAIGPGTPSITAAPVAHVGSGVAIIDPDLRPPAYCAQDPALLYAGRYSSPPGLVPEAGILVLAQEIRGEREKAAAVANAAAVKSALKSRVNAQKLTAADGQRRSLTIRAGGVERVGTTGRVLYWAAVEAPRSGVSGVLLSQAITGAMTTVGRSYGIAVGPSSPVYVRPSGRTGPRYQDLWEAALFSVGALSDLVAGLRVGFRRGSIDDQANSMVNGVAANFETLVRGADAVRSAEGTAAQAVAIGEAALGMKPATAGYEEIRRARKMIDDADAMILRAEEVRARGGLVAMAQNVATRIPGLVRSALDREVTASNRDARFSGIQKQYIACEYYKQASAVYGPLRARISALQGRAREIEQAWDAIVPMIPNARGAFTAARAKLDEIESRLDLPWYAKRLGPLPVWGWGLIGVGVVGGGGILIARRRS